jgi:hypothetical protein
MDMFDDLDAIYREEAMAVFAAKGDAAAFFGTNEKRAKLLYKRLAAMFHPDVFSEARHKQDAEQVFKELGAIWDAYKAMHDFKAAPVFGDLEIAGVAYMIAGEARNLSNRTFKAFTVVRAPGGAPRILFVARASGGNTGYADILFKIKNYGICEDLFAGYGSREFAVGQKDGRHSAFTTLIPDSDKWRSLGHVAETGKLDAKDIAWIWRRVLSAAAVCADLSAGFGFARDASYIEPERHGYIHMCFCARPAHRSVADLAPAAEFMISVCDAMPDQMHRYFVEVSRPDMSPRTHPAELLADFDYVLERLWGSKKFHHFTYPKNWK